MAVQREEVLKRLGTCARCRQCRMVCEIPIAKTMLPVCPSGEYFKYDAYFASGRITLAKKYLLGKIDFDPSLLKTIYSCALCGSCKQQCPIIGFDPMEATTVMRELAVEAGLADDYYPAPGEKPIDVDLLDEAQSTTALFAGCESQSDRATVEVVAGLLRNNGVSFRVLTGSCCGAYLLRKGDVEGFEQRKAENIANFKRMDLQRIIVNDPLCYKTLKQDYALKEHGIKVVYYLEPLASKQSENLIKTAQNRQKLAYHDPCYLGRYMGVYDLPRQIIAGLGAYDLVEFKRNRENALCCGGMPDWIESAGEASATDRIKEAEEVGADLVVSACRNCSEQLRQASEKSGSRVVVKDLLSLLQESLVC